MSQEQDDLDERLAGISTKLANLRAVSADTHEEVLVATEQLIEHALSTHRATVEATRLVRAASARERAGKRQRQRRIHR